MRRSRRWCKAGIEKRAGASAKRAGRGTEELEQAGVGDGKEKDQEAT